MVIMLLGIGWSLDDDHDFDTLMVTVLISSMILFLLCLSTNVQQDMTVYDQHEETASFVSYYKPYSLFHEHLSHISEESSIDTTLNNDLNRKLIGIPYELAQQSPCPPTQSAAIVLINLPTYLRETDNDSSKIISNSFLCSMFTLGVIWGMTQSLLFVYLDKMNIPMHTIGAVGSVMIITDLLAQFITSMIYESQFWVIIVYSLLMISMICNALWLKSGHLITQLLVIFLQFIQGLSFQIIWLLATHKADNLIVSEYKRSIIKGSMAVLYHSIGPAVGVLWMAYLVSSNDSYTLVYQYAACITLISGFSSWNWINYCKL
ncbi:uncharacterized protein BX663DRAFT_527656 [Cokeromyces recurvatus]|uniref:uncharacterized protein n=1 Tax=Cokeromyces recurvatus TaxID=90255 RepID=UPI00221FBF1B|nr:uncharacterized protein BX663DRAFT_527656 [Cokeromyces recurvatus]KAI7897599.1 hypothetical protein BX663DRAFT_527656 [Cokeromyces recurvatus]